MEKLDKIVDALDSIASELSDSKQIKFEVDDFNMLAFIGENLWEISNTLKKIEAKMK
jgi:hypothetical protein